MTLTFTNKGRSTLAAPCLIGALTITIQAGDVGKFPSSGNFDLILNNAEFVTVTGGQGTATLTVTRARYTGDGGAAAAAYSTGTSVVEVETAEELAQLLQIGFPFGTTSLSKSASYTVTVTDPHVVYVTGAAGPTITLPSAVLVGAGSVYLVINNGTTVTATTINATAGNINGGASITLAAGYGAARLISDGANYNTI